MLTSTFRRAFGPSLLAALALALSPACGGDDAWPVDDPEATAERLEEMRLRSWDLPGTFQLSNQGHNTNEDVAAASVDPNARRDQFARWGRVVAYSQEFLSEEEALAVRFQTVIYATEDGARQSFKATPSVFQDARVSVTRSEVTLETPLGDEARGYRLRYEAEDGSEATGYYLTWRRGRAVLSAQTLVFEGDAEQGRAEELAAVLDRRLSESGLH